MIAAIRRLMRGSAFRREAFVTALGDLVFGRSLAAALTRDMALFFLFNAVVITGIIWAFSPIGFTYNVLQSVWNLLNGHSGDDSWGPMAMALWYLETPHVKPLYTEVFFGWHAKFQYPPSALLALLAMRLIAPGRVSTSDFYNGPWPSLNDILGWIFVLATAMATAMLLEARLRRHEPEADFSRFIALRALLVAGFTLTFAPISAAYTLGQIQVWINAMFAIALLCWASDRKLAAGALTGAVCLIKPHFALFFVWALLRREWSFIAAGAAAGACGLAVSIAVFGFENHVDYLPVLTYLSQHGETYFANQSINGLLNRLMSIGQPNLYHNIEWRAGQFPPFNLWVYAGTMLSSALILGFALFRRSATGDPDRVLDFCTMGVSLTLASPIAWQHHYGILLPVFAAALAASLRSRGRLIWLIVAYALTSPFIASTMLLAPTVFNVLQSHVLFGALILLLLLHRRHAAATIARAG